MEEKGGEGEKRQIVLKKLVCHCKILFFFFFWRREDRLTRHGGSLRQVACSFRNYKI